MASSVLEKARVVHHDQVVAKPLGFVDGRVGDAQANAFRVDLRDHLIFPGFINAHDHLQLNNVPPLTHAEPFPNSYAWIDAFESYGKTSAVVDATGVPSATRSWQGGLKNLLSGVTTVAHHDPWNAVFENASFPVSVMRDYGWAHSLGLGQPGNGLPSRYGPSVHGSFMATPSEQPWIMHLAEGTDDIANAELGQLVSLGCLGPNTIIVHGVGLTSTDVERVIESGAAVVWCPASNLAMLGRTMHSRAVRRLFDAGRLALGSDSRLTGARDLLDELVVAAANSDLTPAELLRLVTRDASQVLRLRGAGGLTAGQQADCVIIRERTDQNAVLGSIDRSGIRAVVRGGAPVVADPDFAEWFSQCGVAFVRVRLDGRPKLLALHVAQLDAVALEPGLELQ
jgi:cytosine/adenosine deaminase-related metal-dependent hydrolase